MSGRVQPSRLISVSRVRTDPIYFFVLLVLFIFSKDSSAQPTELTSPNGRHSLRIMEQSLPHTDLVYGNSTLVLSKRDRAITKVPTTGYLISALWSPDGRYVAVNNRRGNSGDYVWIFSLIDGRALKSPDDDSFSFPISKITKLYPDCNEGSFDRDLTVAKAWKSGNELEVEMRWRFYKAALIVRHAVYKISGRQLMLVDQQISRHPVNWQPARDRESAICLRKGLSGEVLKHLRFQSSLKPGIRP